MRPSVNLINTQLHQQISETVILAKNEFTNCILNENYAMLISLPCTDACKLISKLYGSLCAR